MAGGARPVRYRQLHGVAWPPSGYRPPPPPPPGEEAPLPPPPSETLQLEWVHGYAGVRGRHNVLLTARGELVYFAAALGIVLDPEARTQRYHAGPSSPRHVRVSRGLCCALNLNATGQSRVTLSPR